LTGNGRLLRQAGPMRAARLWRRPRQTAGPAGAGQTAGLLPGRGTARTDRQPAGLGRADRTAGSVGATTRPTGSSGGTAGRTGEPIGLLVGRDAPTGRHPARGLLSRRLLLARAGRRLARALAGPRSSAGTSARCTTGGYLARSRLRHTGPNRTGLNRTGLNRCRGTGAGLT
jgi:hypothetical protein